QHWIDAPGRGDRRPAAWSATRVLAIAALCVALVPIVVFGLYNRAVELTTQTVVVLALAGVAMTRRPGSATEETLRSLYLWGAVCSPLRPAKRCCAVFLKRRWWCWRFAR